MDRLYIGEDCRTIHYYGYASFTDGSYFLYGYREGKCSTGDVLVKELEKACQ